MIRFGPSGAFAITRSAEQQSRLDCAAQTWLRLGGCHPLPPDPRRGLRFSGRRHRPSSPRDAASVAEDTSDGLRGRRAAAGTELLLDRLLEGLGVAHEQVGEPSYAHKLDPAELHLDWSGPAEHLHRVVRLGRAWTTLGGHRLIV